MDKIENLTENGNAIVGAADELHALAHRVPSLFVSLGMSPETSDCEDSILFVGHACREILGEECPEDALEAVRELVRCLWDAVERARAKEYTVMLPALGPPVARLGRRLYYIEAEQLVAMGSCSCGPWCDPRCYVTEHRRKAAGRDSIGRTRRVMRAIRAKRLGLVLDRNSILCFGTGSRSADRAGLN